LPIQVSSSLGLGMHCSRKNKSARSKGRTHSI
jgi:hypothetical protein